MNASIVACPTCSARRGVVCKPFRSDERVPHVGRVRIARATEAGKRLRFGFAGFVLGGWSSYYVLTDDASTTPGIGTVWQTSEGRWTCALNDDTIVTRDWKGTRATCAAFLLDPVGLPLEESK